MFNTIAFNRAPFNRYVAGGESFMPSGAAYAETEAIGAIRLIKRMDGSGRSPQPDVRPGGSGGRCPR